MSCPVCFNAASTDDTVRQSINLGIFVLMGVTAVVLAGFLRFIISIVRRSKADLKVGLYGGYATPPSSATVADLKVGLYDVRGAASSSSVEAGLQAGLPL